MFQNIIAGPPGSATYHLAAQAVDLLHNALFVHSGQSAVTNHDFAIHNSAVDNVGAAAKDHSGKWIVKCACKANLVQINQNAVSRPAELKASDVVAAEEPRSPARGKPQCLLGRHRTHTRAQAVHEQTLAHFAEHV